MGMTTAGRGYPVPDRNERATVPYHLTLLANAIGTDITNNLGKAVANTETLKANLAQEIVDRTVGDKNLQDQVTAEVGERSREDVAIRQSLNNATGRDTGWRSIPFNNPELVSAGDGANRTPFLHIRRVSNTVYVRGYAKITGSTATGVQIYTVPGGFRDVPPTDSAYWSWRGECTGYGFASVEDSKGTVQYTPWTNGLYANSVTTNGSAWAAGTGFVIIWTTDQAWPTTLPGTQFTPPSPNGGAATGTSLTLEKLNSDLQNFMTEERKVRAAADTALGDRATALEKRTSSAESTLVTHTAGIKSVKDAVDKIIEDQNYEFQAYMFDLIRKQWQPGGGFNVLYAGSSTAEGYGSVGMNNTTYDGRSWVERVNAVMTPNPIKWNIDGKGAVFAPPSTGIWGYQFAQGGTTSADYMPASKITQAGTVKPAVMFHAVGSNNYGNQWGLADFESQVIGVIEAVNKVSPATKHVLVTYQTQNNKDGNNPPLTWWQYNDVLKKIAVARADTYFFDLSPDTWTMGMPGANHWWYYQTDGNHVHATTHRYFAEKILAKMGLAIPPQGPEVYPWPVFGGGDKSAGTTITTRSVSLRPFPRYIVTTGVVFGRAITGGQYFNLKLKGNTDTPISLTTNSTTSATGMALSHSFYCPPGVEGIVTLSVDNSNGYVSGTADYQSVTSTAYLV